ncbi:MAG: nuclease [Candidatus Thorarchaeota archaeon]|nr:MAG: nuclease [Candidatus Thorarchaeota archaeon]
MLNEFTNHPQKILYPYNTYRAMCKEVYDGDTFTMLVDLGFYTYTNIRVRLQSVDTPEIRTKDPVEKIAGFAARDRVIELILNQPCVIITDKDTTSFDRWIAEVYYFGVDGVLVHLGQQLINEGFAEPFTK